MEMSPGVELVWALAGRETAAAKMKEVEPDHFFCALLKFSEMTDDELILVATALPAGKHLALERDGLRRSLSEHGVKSTSQIRHAIRRALGQGNHRSGGEALHRSEESRRLFETASLLATQGHLDCTVLLVALMSCPTRAMVEAMGGPRKMAPQPIVPGAESPAASRYAQDVLQLAKNGVFDAPPTSKPQIEVLSGALKSTDPTPMLLVCEPRVKILPIVGCAAQQVQSQRPVARIDVAAIRRDEPDAAGRADAIARVFADASATNDRALFFDLTEPRDNDLDVLLRALPPLLKDGGPRVLLAVSAETYARAVERNADLEETFRSIWFHDLSEVGMPAEL